MVDLTMTAIVTALGKGRANDLIDLSILYRANSSGFASDELGQLP